MLAGALSGAAFPKSKALGIHTPASPSDLGFRNRNGAADGSDFADRPISDGRARAGTWSVRRLGRLLEPLPNPGQDGLRRPPCHLRGRQLWTPRRGLSRDGLRECRSCCRSRGLEVAVARVIPGRLGCSPGRRPRREWPRNVVQLRHGGCPGCHDWNGLLLGRHDRDGRPVGRLVFGFLVELDGRDHRAAAAAGTAATASARET